MHLVVGPDQLRSDALTAEVVALWCAPWLGDRRMDWCDLGVAATAQDVDAALGDVRLGPGSAAVVFITARGTRGRGRGHGLVLADGGELRTRELLTKLASTSAGHLMVVVNAEYAGDLQDEPGLTGCHRSMALFVTGDVDGNNPPGELARVLADVRAALTSGRPGLARPLLSFDEFRTEVETARRRLGASGLWPVSGAASTADPSPCLPNPACHGEGRTGRELDEWVSRASGRLGPQDRGWYFTGREALSARLAEFMNSGRGMLIVSGPAGTGKSALIARAVLLGDRRFRDSPDTAHLTGADGVREADVALHLRDKTVHEIVAALVDGFGLRVLPGERTADLVRRMGEAATNRPGCTVVLDGLDEALSPLSVVTSVISELLAATARSSGRLVVGVRGDGRTPVIDVLRGVTAEPVAVLRPDSADPQDDIRGFVEKRLAARFPGVGPLTALAQRVAHAVSPSFLDAATACARIEALRTPPHPDDVRLGEILRDGTLGALRADIADSATPGFPAPVVLAVLRASAFALGSGVARSDIWSTVAGALARGPVPDAAVDHVLASRLVGYLTSHVIEGQVVHSPFHRRITDLLRDSPQSLVPGTDEDTQASAHRRITRALVAALPADPEGEPHPYLRRHLVAHAARGGVLDDETVPAEFLPWDRAGVRVNLGQPVMGSGALAAWSRVEPFLGDADRRTRVASLDLATAAATRLPGSAAHAPGLRVRCADWRLEGNVVANTVGHLTGMAVLRGPAGDPLLAVGDANGDIQLWNPATGAPAGPPMGEGGGWHVTVETVHARDGRPLVVASYRDRLIRLWDPLSGIQVSPPRRFHEGRCVVLTVVPDRVAGRELVISACEAGRVVAWYPDDVDPACGPVDLGAAVHDLVVLARSDRTHLVAAITEMKVVLIDPFTMTVRGDGIDLRYPAAVGAAVPTEDGNDLLAVGDRLVQVLTTEGEVVTRLPGAFGLRAMVTVLDERGRVLLATGEQDGTIKLHSADTGKPVGQAHVGQRGPVMSLAVLPPEIGPAVLASADGTTVRVWQPTGADDPGGYRSSPRTTANRVVALPLPDDQVIIAVLNEDYSIRLWNGRTGHAIAGLRLEAPTDFFAIAAVPDSRGALLLTMDDRDGVRLWDPKTGAVVGGAQYAGPTTARDLVAFSLADGSVHAAAGSQLDRIQVWDVRTGAPWRTQPSFAGSESLQALETCVDESGRVLLLALTSSDLAALDLFLGSEVHFEHPPLPSHPARLATIRGEHGTIVVVAGSAKITAWYLGTGEALGTLDVRARSLACVNLADNRSVAAIGTRTGAVVLWEPGASGGEHRLVTGADVTAMCAFGDGATAATSLIAAGAAGVIVFDTVAVEERAWVRGENPQVHNSVVAGQVENSTIILAGGDVLFHSTDRAPVAQNPVKEVLAVVVREQWGDEARIRGMADEPSLSRWRVVDDTTAPSAVHDSARLITWLRGEHERGVVVIGDEGSGKSRLAVALMTGFPTPDETDLPVPVLLPLSTWIISIEPDIDEWVRRMLAEMYAPSRALPHEELQVLFDERQLLLVLDGFDEIPAARRAHALTELKRLNDQDQPIVLLTRGEEFRAAVAATGAPLDCPVVEAVPLSAEAAATHLLPIANGTGWPEAVTAVRAHQARGFGDLLSTPYGLWLARTAATRTTIDPRPLLALDNSEAVRDALLTAVLPAISGSDARHQQLTAFAQFARTRFDLIPWWFLTPRTGRKSRSATIGVPALGALVGMLLGVIAPSSGAPTGFHLLIGALTGAGAVLLARRLARRSSVQRVPRFVRLRTGTMAAAGVLAASVIGAIGALADWSIPLLVTAIAAAGTSSASLVHQIQPPFAPPNDPRSTWRAERLLALTTCATLTSWSCLLTALLHVAFALPGPLQIAVWSTVLVIAPHTNGPWPSAVAAMHHAATDHGTPRRLMRFLHSARGDGIFHAIGPYYCWRHRSFSDHVGRERLEDDLPERAAR